MAFWVLVVLPYTCLLLHLIAIGVYFGVIGFDYSLDCDKNDVKTVCFLEGALFALVSFLV